MLDVAWPELLVIGAVALVAIGPKDLPKVMQALGRFVGKARSIGREMHNSFEQLSYEAEMADKLKKDGEKSDKPPPKDEA